MIYQHNEHSKYMQEQKDKEIKAQLLRLGCVCWDCDDLTDEELGEVLNEQKVA